MLSEISVGWSTRYGDIPVMQLPVNLRWFGGVEWKDIRVKKGSWKDALPNYEVK